MGPPPLPARNVIAILFAALEASVLVSSLPVSGHTSGIIRRPASGNERLQRQQADGHSGSLVLEAAGSFRPLERRDSVKAPTTHGAAWSVVQNMTAEEQSMWRSRLRTRQAGINVTMWSADGLRGGSIFDRDAYCSCVIVGKPESAFSTNVSFGTEKPRWDSSFIITDFEEGDKLEFKVMDKYKEPAAAQWARSKLGRPSAKDEELGEAVVHSDMFFPMGYEGHVRLVHAGKEGAYIEVKIHAVNITIPVGNETVAEGTGDSEPESPSEARSRDIGTEGAGLSEAVVSKVPASLVTRPAGSGARQEHLLRPPDFLEG